MQNSASTLRSRRCDVVRDPTGRKEEQRDQCATLRLRIVMAPRCWRCPPATAPAIESGEQSSRIERHHQIELAVRMEVIVTAKDYLGVVSAFHAVHINGCDTEVGCLGTRLQDPAAPIPRAVEFDICRPAFCYAGRYETCEFIVQIGTGPIGVVEPLLDFSPGCQVLDFLKEWDAAGDQCFAFIHGGDLLLKTLGTTVAPRPQYPSASAQGDRACAWRAALAPHWSSAPGVGGWRRRTPG